MVAIGEKVLRFGDEMVREFWDFADHPQRAESCLERGLAHHATNTKPGYAPSCECMCYSTQAASRSRWPNHATSLLKQYWRMCIMQGRQHTCWSGSCRCKDSLNDTMTLNAKTYFFNELVTNVNTSWLSSSNSIIPRYPSRLSAKRGLATSLRHSI